MRVSLLAAVLAALLCCWLPSPTPCAAEPNGDYSGDGRVDIADAVLTLRAVIGLEVPTAEQMSRADVDQNGRLDVADTIQVLRILLGLGSQEARPNLPPEAGLTVSPAEATLTTETPQTFAARVSGMEDAGVIWSVREGAVGGAVDTEGVYTPPKAPGVYHVVAASKAEPRLRAEASVTVLAEPAPEPVTPSRPVLVLGEPARNPIVPVMPVAPALRVKAQPLQGTRIIGVDDDSVTVADAGPALEPGSVIVSAENGGLLRKVVGTRQVGRNTVLQTVPAALTDLFDQLDLSLTQKLPVLDPQAIATLPPGVSILPGGQTPSAGCPFGPGNVLHLSHVPFPPAPASPWLYLDVDLNLDLDFDLALKIGSELLDPIPKVKEFRFVTNTQAAVSGGVDVVAPINIPLKSFPLIPSTPLPPIVVGVGPVSIVFNPYFAMDVRVQGTIGPGTNAAVCLSDTGKFGVRYRKGKGWDVVAESNPKSSMTPLEETDPNIGLRVSLSPRVDVLVYNTVGPYVRFDVPYLQLDAGLRSCPSETFFTARLGFAGDAGVTLADWVKKLEDLLHLPDFLPHSYAIADYDLGSTVYNRVFPHQTTMEASAPSLDFGTQPMGVQGAERTVTLRNTGTNSLAVDDITVLGPDAADFALVTDDARGRCLQPGKGFQSSERLGLRFTPSAPGPRKAQLRILSRYTETGSALVDLTGVGGPPMLTGLSFPPGGRPGGCPTTGTVSLSAPAPEDAAVTLATDDGTLATVPAAVTIPRGQSSASFPIDTRAVTQETAVGLTASSSGTTVTGSLMLAPAPEIQSLTLSAESVQGGGTVLGTVRLKRASLGPLRVSLSSSDPALASVPASVAILPGTAIGLFQVTTQPLAPPKPRDPRLPPEPDPGVAVTITACGSGANTAQLRITRPILVR